MKKYIFCFPLFFLLLGCSLSAKQEASLNLALSKYLQSRNKCHVVSLVGFTYPELVKFYSQQGDSVFQKAFDCQSLDKYQYELYDPNLKSIRKKKARIQVKYELKKKRDYKDEGFLVLFAISENAGENWYFLEKIDYYDKTKCKSLIRLF